MKLNTLKVFDLTHLLIYSSKKNKKSPPHFYRILKSGSKSYILC